MSMKRKYQVEWGLC